MKSYAATIMNTQLVPLARQRAALKDWSHGGWPDQYGAEVMGNYSGEYVYIAKATISINSSIL